ncbi:phosphonate ABC transporter ATP-binding protein [Herminiimonas sp. NPDC097707]|uniref:phosphonate ABC transporter ATP-binding protein n=1 Tax=Herminiimonas sp. NPDC097707 TaxID=3364007 RepID=UPI00383A4666
MTFLLNSISAHYSGAAKSSFALRDLTLTIAQGEQIALIGPSGAGKTSLLHTLACALKPAQGEMQMFGNNPWQLDSAARHRMRARLFLAPQTPPLPPRQRVVNAVLAGALPQWSVWQAIRSLIKPVEVDAAYRALLPFNLQDKLYARVDRLSGGERQRCGMARALISSAEAFLVDEPLSALDPTLALQTLKVLQQEAQQRHATLVCSLHQVELARANFPRIIGLRDGRIVFDASSADISDAMIAALYQNTNDDSAAGIAAEHAAIDPMSRC